MHDSKHHAASLQSLVYLFFSDECGVKVRQLDWTTDDFLAGYTL